jgi:hypothetical protein
MAKYPEYSEVLMQPVVSSRLEWKTEFAIFNQMGKERRRQKWLYPRRHFFVRYQSITKVTAETLWEFYMARKGSFSAFNFFLPEPQSSYPSYLSEYVAAGDGSTAVFTLPSRAATLRTLYADGSELTEGVDYNFTSLGGEDGADQINFSDSAMIAPSDGVIITYDFTGTLKVRCRFAEDIFEFETFRDRVVSTGVELTGLLHNG